MSVLDPVFERSFGSSHKYHGCFSYFFKHPSYVQAVLVRQVFPKLRRGATTVGEAKDVRQMQHSIKPWNDVHPPPSRGGFAFGSFNGGNRKPSLGIFGELTIYTIPGTQMTSIFEGQPSKTRPFPIKTRVIWVPGICIYIYTIILYI